MSQNDDYQKLARQFADMWQEHMASMMNDSEFIRALLQMMQSSQFSGKDNTQYANPFVQQTGSAAAAPDARDAALARIERSLGAIEERIGQLERKQSKSVKPNNKARISVAKTAQRSKARPGSGSRNKKKSH